MRRPGGCHGCGDPIERKLGIMRGCLEVCAEYKNPVGIITKSPVIERDVDVLQQLARDAAVRVSISVPFWDEDVARAMEPSVTTPARRMRIVETLAKAGIPVGVSVSPIVPGLNDDAIGQVLEAAAAAGATHAFFVMLRLPGAVQETFERALRTHLPLRAEKVLRRLREMHGGKVYDATEATGPCREPSATRARPRVVSSATRWRATGSPAPARPAAMPVTCFWIVLFIDPMWPRSLVRVAMATAQPSCSGPRRASAGIRASVR